jgi:hypothetical protein
MKSWSSLRRHCSVLFTLLFVTIGATMGAIPRPEHPRPQFHRDTWLNLNGQWNFAFDFDLVGLEQGWAKDPSGFDKKIIVPFCPESKLSGIEYKAFIRAVWYHRTFSVPNDCGGSHSFANPHGVHNHQREWTEVAMRDLNHPSIVAWTPFSKTRGAARLRKYFGAPAAIERSGD